MKTSSQILAYIKGQAEAIGGEVEDRRGMSFETRCALKARLEVLKGLQQWIEKPAVHDPDAFSSSVVR